MATAHPEVPRPVLSPTEAAARADCSTFWFYELLRRGQGPPSFKQRGRRYFPVDQFEAWLAKHRQAQS
jgi:hypothetical protein